MSKRHREALLITGVAGLRDWNGFHRVVSVARWDRDEVGRRLLRWLVARWGTGALRFVVDGTLAPHKGPHVFGLGCHLEPMFRDTKQLLGFTESSARTSAAVERTTPMAALLDAILTLWFDAARLGDALDVIPERPWYPAKRHVSFADILRTAQDVISQVDLPAKLPQIDNFARHGRRPSSGEQLRFSFAA